MKPYLTRLSVLIGAPLIGALALTGCAAIDHPPSAAELGAAVCEPAGPHDAAAPGDWICEGEDPGERLQPRHRVEG